MKNETIETLMRFVRILDNGCWEWTASCRTDGYGQINIDGKTRAAHRVFFSLTTGLPLFFSYHVCHTCDFRRCVNPAHLFKGNASINAKDACQKGRMSGWIKPAGTHCKRGHKFTTETIYNKSNGRRCCLICLNVARKNWRDKHK